MEGKVELCRFFVRFFIAAKKADLKRTIRFFLVFKGQVAPSLLLSKRTNPEHALFDSGGQVIDRPHHCLAHDSHANEADVKVDDRGEAIHWEPKSDHFPDNSLLDPRDRVRDANLWEEQVVLVRVERGIQL